MTYCLNLKEDTNNMFIIGVLLLRTIILNIFIKYLILKIQLLVLKTLDCQTYFYVAQRQIEIQFKFYFFKIKTDN